MSAVLDRLLVQALTEAEWLPADAALDVPASPNFLSAISYATDTASGQTCQSSSEEFRRWLKELIAQGATLELLGSRRPAICEWLGPRLLFSPRSFPGQRLVGLASSRLGRRLDTQQAWFKMFRAACSKIDVQHETLLTAESTTTARFVERAAKLFDVPVFSLVPPSARTSVVTWLRHLQSLDTDQGNVHRVYISPELLPATRVGPLDAFPLRDRSVLALSDHVLVFHIRPAGQLDVLIRARLSDAGWQRVRRVG
ncbi:MAG: hypothetical protein CMJ64_05750 [Planctomycetaceae bacterium]|nr:hypothetical protein [Planctomycetaceae bacterium]